MGWWHIDPGYSVVVYQDDYQDDYKRAVSSASN
jgi:uncharacterized membrane protein